MDINNKKELLKKLELISSELKEKFDRIEFVTEYLKTDEIQELISHLVTKYHDNIDIVDAEEYQIISYLLEFAYYIYTYSDKYTGMTDTEYDILYAAYENTTRMHGNDEFITLPIIDETKAIDYHKYPLLRGTLEKIHYLEEPDGKLAKSRKSLDKWISSTEALYFELTGNKIDLRKEEVYIFPKWDGVSVVFEFGENGELDKALTRGFTKLNKAENITRHFNGFERPLNGKPYGLKTEIMCKESDVFTYNLAYDTDYKQSRSIVSGLLNSLESDGRRSYLQVIQLRYMEDGDTIEKLCPEVFQHPYLRCNLGDTDAIEKFAENHKFTEGLRCDGVVIHIINPEIQSVLGRKNDKNRFEVAYKFTEEYTYSKVEDIDFQVGLFGTINPVVKFKPVKLKGNTIDSASLGSIERCKDMKLRRGDKIKVSYDIIPYASFDISDPKCKRGKNKPIEIPSRCPSCDAELEEQGTMLICKNPKCECRIKGKILNYLNKLDIQDISYATISLLYDNKIVRTIEDLYKLTKQKSEILNLPGMGEAKYDNMIYQINSKRIVTESELLGAIGILGVGETTFKKVLSIYTFQDIMDFANDPSADTSIQLLAAVKGIGNSIADKIITGINENQKLIEFLLDELNVVKDKTTGPVKFSVCFTNVRNKELEEWIEENGGKIDSIVSKATSYVVVPMIGVDSVKTKRAEEYGIPIVEIDNLKNRIETDYRF